MMETLNPKTDDIITFHHNELQTLWEGTSSACDLSLLQDIGTDKMIGGHTINQLLRWSLWGKTAKWGLSPHRLRNSHIFCTFAWMHLEAAYGKLTIDNDWSSFKQTLLRIPELAKPTAVKSVYFPVNIPGAHWYIGILLLHENAPPNSSLTPYSPSQTQPDSRNPPTQYGHGSKPYGTKTSPPR
jgi:hypothetical protein